MDELKDRLKYARILRGLSQQQLGKKVPTSQSTINDLESGRIKTSKYLMGIADCLEVDMRWLTEGVGTLSGEGIKIVNQGAPLPMYDWDDLPHLLIEKGTSRDVIDLSHRCPVTHSAKAFCLGMTNTQAIGKIGAGEIIFVDPECRYANGSYVIAFINKTPVLRQLVSDGIHTYLKTDNPLIPDDTQTLKARLTVLGDEDLLDVPVTDDGVDVLLGGRVIMREEIYI